MNATNHHRDVVASDVTSAFKLDVNNVAVLGGEILCGGLSRVAKLTIRLVSL